MYDRIRFPIYRFIKLSIYGVENIIYRIAYMVSKISFIVSHRFDFSFVRIELDNSSIFIKYRYRIELNYRSMSIIYRYRIAHIELDSHAIFIAIVNNSSALYFPYLARVRLLVQSHPELEKQSNELRGPRASPSTPAPHKPTRRNAAPRLFDTFSSCAAVESPPAGGKGSIAVLPLGLAS